MLVFESFLRATTQVLRSEAKGAFYGRCSGGRGDAAVAEETQRRLCNLVGPVAAVLHYM